MRLLAQGQLMQLRRTVSCYLLLAGLFFSAGALGQQPAVPNLIRYSGTLRSPDGSPLSRITGVTFAIYKDEQDGAPLWIETQNVTPDDRGEYSVLLGKERSGGIPAELFTSGDPRWLGIQVEGVPELPRVYLATVPYAMKSADAQTLGGRPASSYMLVPSERTQNGDSAVSLPGTPVSPDIGLALSSETGVPNYIAKFLSGSTLGPSQISDTSSGVGVRIATPEQPLDVLGRMQLRSDGLSTGGLWLKGTDSTAKIFVGLMGPNSLDRFGIYHNGMWRFIVDSNGYVGIGTIPEHRFDMTGRMRIRATGSWTPGIWLGPASGDAAAFIGQVGTKAADPIGFFHTGVWRMTVGSTGNVGINMDLAQERLDVKGRLRLRPEGTQAAGLWLGGTTGLAPIFVGQTGTNNNDPVGIFHSGAWRLAVDSSGRVGIGTTQPASTLDVAGDLRLSGTAGITFPDGTSQITAARSFSLTAADTSISVTSEATGARVALAPAGVTSANLAVQSVTAAAIADGAVTGQKIAAGAVSTQHIEALSVDTSKLANAAVNSAKLAPGAIVASIVDASLSGTKLTDSSVTGAKIAAASIGSAHLTDSSVTSQILADSSITTAKLADASVTAVKLAPGAVDASALSDNSIPGSKLTDASVPGTKLLDASISSAKLAASSISESQLFDAAVTSRKLADASVTSAKLADASVTFSKLAPGAVTDSMFGDNSIAGSKLLNASIQSAKLADGAITASKLAPGAVSSATITDNSLSGLKLMDSSLPGSKLQNSAVTNVKLADSSVTAAKIGDSSVSTRALQDASITTAKLADGAVTATKLALGTIPPSAVSGTAAILGSNNFVGDQIVSGSIVANTLAVSGSVQINATNIGSTNGSIPAITAHNDATTGTAYAVEAITASTGGRAIYARALAATGATVAVQGRADSTAGTAIEGLAYSGTGNTISVRAWNSSATGTAVLAESVSKTGANLGVKSTAAGIGGSVALLGIASATSTTSATYGLRAESASQLGIGSLSYASSGTGTTKGVVGKVESAQGVAAEFTNYGGGDLITGYNGTMRLFRVDGAGDVWAAGVFRANGADYAEMVAVIGERSQYSPGDVLVISMESDRSLALSTEPYATSVAGIFSTRPGVLGSQHSLNDTPPLNEVPLAVVGIVPGKASAENGPIRRGDLLVTSSTPGYLMRGTDRSRMLGAVVGKAMQPLDAGTGVIEVLVTIQ